LRLDHGRYDVIFLDPPFRSAPWPDLLSLIVPRLKSDALVYCESGRALEPGEGWETWRRGRAGQVAFQLIRRIRHEQESGLPGNV
ncbi:MAG: RsmD family RNA methyltransferase, partial [Burkholderiales bacterium]|nr:RsmD family RNA methyltransferase [Burkholderiales bacterium]